MDARAMVRGSVVAVLALAAAACGFAPTAAPTAAPRTAAAAPPTGIATPLPPPVTDTLWTRDGTPVPWSVIHVEPGPGHCDLGDLLVLRFDRNLGQAQRSTERSLEYVRDPLNRMAPGAPGATDLPWATVGRFEPSVPRPPDAVFTGFVSADLMELWRVPTNESRVYLLRGRTWEQWPAIAEPIGCT